MNQKVVMLSDKIVAAAKAEIEEQENVPATVARWVLFNARLHETIASVEVITEGPSKAHAFIVWVVANLDTEEVYCL